MNVRELISYGTTRPASGPRATRDAPFPWPRRRETRSFRTGVAVLALRNSLIARKDVYSTSHRARKFGKLTPMKLTLQRAEREI
jgi:hypothetical protein